MLPLRRVCTKVAVDSVRGSRFLCYSKHGPREPFSTPSFFVPIFDEQREHHRAWTSDENEDNRE
jgi:hypothetical protein